MSDDVGSNITLDRRRVAARSVLEWRPPSQSSLYLEALSDLLDCHPDRDYLGLSLQSDAIRIDESLVILSYLADTALRQTEDVSHSEQNDGRSDQNPASPEDEGGSAWAAAIGFRMMLFILRGLGVWQQYLVYVLRGVGFSVYDFLGLSRFVAQKQRDLIWERLEVVHWLSVGMLSSEKIQELSAKCLILIAFGYERSQYNQLYADIKDQIGSIGNDYIVRYEQRMRQQIRWGIILAYSIPMMTIAFASSFQSSDALFPFLQPLFGLDKSFLSRLPAYVILAVIPLFIFSSIMFIFLWRFKQVSVHTVVASFANTIIEAHVFKNALHSDFLRGYIRSGGSRDNRTYDRSYWMISGNQVIKEQLLCAVSISPTVLKRLLVRDEDKNWIAQYAPDTSSPFSMTVLDFLSSTRSTNQLTWLDDFLDDTLMTSLAEQVLSCLNIASESVVREALQLVTRNDPLMVQRRQLMRWICRVKIVEGGEPWPELVAENSLKATSD